MANARTVLTLDLEPVIGRRFQPTGFPNLGPATYPGDDGTSTDLLLESAQSMANRLEGTTWDDASQQQHPDLEGLPYARIVDPAGVFLSSSRLEAHRLASAYVMDGTIGGRKGEEVVKDLLGQSAGRPLDHRTVARAVFALDPLALIHGVFFSRKGIVWNPKVTRAVTGFIEAYDICEAVSGGVKRDSVNATQNKEGGGSAETGYGFVPFGRTEYTAKKITAAFVVDHQQIRSYGLSAEATQLLETVVTWELAQLFSNGLRLRTACDLQVTAQDEDKVPDLRQAQDAVRAAIAACGDQLGSITTVTWVAGKAAKAETAK